MTPVVRTETSNGLSKEGRRFARNRAIEIIDGNPKIKFDEVVEQIRELAGMEAMKIATEAVEFQKVILIAVEYFFEKNLPGKGFDMLNIEFGTMEARMKIGSTLRDKPLFAAFFIGHKRYLATKAAIEQKKLAAKKEPRILVDGKPIDELMEDGNGAWYTMFSAGQKELQRNPNMMWSELVEKMEEVLIENNFDRSLYDPALIADQIMAAHREWKLFGLRTNEVLDQPEMAGCSDVCRVADHLMHLIDSTLSEKKRTKKRAKLRTVIRMEMVRRGIRYHDEELEQDKPRQILPKEMAMPKTGKTQKRRESGALARHQQNRSARAAENKLVASGGGSKKKRN